MLTISRLQELFVYDPKTGIFTRKSNGIQVTSGSGKRGKVIYQKILIDGKYTLRTDLLGFMFMVRCHANKLIT